jgi:metal transporter CNNM
MNPTAYWWCLLSFLLFLRYGAAALGSVALSKATRDELLPQNVDDELERAIRLLQATGVYSICRIDYDDDNDRDHGRNPLEGFVRLCSQMTISERKLISAEELEEETSALATVLYNLVAALVCVTTAALAAGLTLGMLGLDPLMLLIKQRAGETPEERQMAGKLLPIVKQHHRLLVTLLLMNACSNEALPIFLEALVPPSVAVLLSVTLVLFFGEIIPSAVFTGPDQLRIASRLTPVVKICMLLLYPVAGPIAKLLDCVLHDDDEHEAYNRGELSALIRIQYEERLAAKRKRKRERARAQQILLEQEQRQKADNEEEKKKNNANRPSFLTSLVGRLSRRKSATPSPPPSNVSSGVMSATHHRPMLPRVGAIDFDPSDGVRLSQIVQDEIDLRAVKNHIEFAEGRAAAGVPAQVIDRGPSRRNLLDKRVSWHHERSLSFRSDSASQQQQQPNHHHNTSDLMDPYLSGGEGADDFSQFTGPTTSDSLHHDEVLIVEGALSMKTKVALDLMRPKRLTYRLPHDLVLNERNLVDIYSSGFSRVPVYRNPPSPGAGVGGADEEYGAVGSSAENSTSAICGVLITKQLIVVNPADCRPLHTLPLYCPTVVGPRTSLVDLLNVLQTGGAGMKGGHLALVCANVEEATAALNRGDPIPASSGWMGIVTLEDVLEAVLQEEIYDEYDNIRTSEQRLGKMLRVAWLKYKMRKARKPGLGKEASKRLSSTSKEPTNEKTALLAPPN